MVFKKSIKDILNKWKNIKNISFFKSFCRRGWYKLLKFIVIAMLIGIAIPVLIPSLNWSLQFDIFPFVDGGNTTFYIHKQTWLPLIQKIDGAVIIASHISQNNESAYCKIQKFFIPREQFNVGWAGLTASSSKYISTAEYSSVYGNTNLKDIINSETFIILEIEYSVGLPFNIALAEPKKFQKAYFPFNINDKMYDLLDIGLQDVPQQIINGDFVDIPTEISSKRGFIEWIDCNNFIIKNMLGTDKELGITEKCKNCMIPAAKN